MTLGLAGCFPLLERPDPTPTPAEQQARAISCEIVVAEWGWAQEAWRQVEQGPYDRAYAQRKADHLAVVADMQAIADRIEDPAVLSALQTTIDAQQKYADYFWDALADVPEGYVASLEDPTNLLFIIGTESAAFHEEILDADLVRYDLCGAVQDGQTTEQACVIATGDWVDAGIEFNDAGGTLNVEDGLTQEEIDQVVSEANAALYELKLALVRVTAPDVLTELQDGYEAYETYIRDGLATLQPTEVALQMTDEEFAAYEAQGEEAFTAWDTRLTAGTENLVTICGAFD